MLSHLGCDLNAGILPVLCVRTISPETVWDRVTQRVLRQELDHEDSPSWEFSSLPERPGELP